MNLETIIKDCEKLLSGDKYELAYYIKEMYYKGYHNGFEDFKKKVEEINEGVSC